MNSLQALRWLRATAACDPKGDYRGPLALLSACGACDWEGAVSARGALRLLPRPPRALPAAARARAARLLGLARLPAGPDREGFWLDAAWDPASGSWSRAAAGGVPGRPRPFRPRDFAAPVGEALARFHALCPLASSRRVGASWSLALERPLPWPLFLRCDLSAAFQPRASQLSLLLRDARVVALDFDGEALWARFRG